MKRDKAYLMEDQVRGLIEELMADVARRETLRSRLVRFLELGSLAITGSVSTFLLVWQL
jgi:hypothetical protein